MALQLFGIELGVDLIDEEGSSQIFRGTDNPTISPGVDASLGSIYLRVFGGTALAYQKTGAAATEWSLLAATSGESDLARSDASGSGTLAVDTVSVSAGMVKWLVKAVSDLNVYACEILAVTNGEIVGHEDYGIIELGDTPLDISIAITLATDTIILEVTSPATVDIQVMRMRLV